MFGAEGGGGGRGTGGGESNEGRKKLVLPSFSLQKHAPTFGDDSYIWEELCRLNSLQEAYTTKAVSELRSSIRLSGDVLRSSGEKNGFAIMVGCLEGLLKIVTEFEEPTPQPRPEQGLKLDVKTRRDRSSKQVSGYQYVLLTDDNNKQQQAYDAINKKHNLPLLTDVAVALIALPMRDFLPARMPLTESEANEQLKAACVTLFQTRYPNLVEKAREKVDGWALSHSLENAAKEFRSRPRREEALLVALMEFPERFYLTCPGGKRQVMPRHPTHTLTLFQTSSLHPFILVASLHACLHVFCGLISFAESFRTIIRCCTIWTSWSWMERAPRTRPTETGPAATPLACRALTVSPPLQKKIM